MYTMNDLMSIFIFTCIYSNKYCVRKSRSNPADGDSLEIKHIYKKKNPLPGRASAMSSIVCKTQLIRKEITN